MIVLFYLILCSGPRNRGSRSFSGIISGSGPTDSQVNAESFRSTDVDRKSSVLIARHAARLENSTISWNNFAEQNIRDNEKLKHVKASLIKINNQTYR